VGGDEAPSQGTEAAHAQQPLGGGEGGGQGVGERDAEVVAVDLQPGRGQQPVARDHRIEGRGVAMPDGSGEIRLQIMQRWHRAPP
jgi:hypothetical protein